MSILMAFLAPFMVAVSFADDDDGGGGDQDPTEAEKKLFGKIEKKMKDYTEGLEGNMLKEAYVEGEIKKLKEELEGMINDTKSKGFEKSINTLKKDVQKQIDEVGLEITKMGDTKPGKTKTIQDLIGEALEVDHIKAYLENGGSGASKKVDLDVKAIVDVAGFTGDVITPARFGPDVAFVPPKKFDIRMAIAMGSSDVDSIDHIKETSLVNNAGFLGENAISGESDLNLEQVKTSSTRIGTHINVSKRSLRNVSFLQTHLANRFTELIAEKVTDSVLNGDGTANTFNGFFNNSTTFTAGSLANSVDEANIADVLAAAIARLAEITNLQATAIFINPLDEYLLTVTKDLQGSYSENTVIVSRVNGRLHINGVPVWSTFHVTQDKYLIADLSATTTELLEVEGLTMRISEEHADNATKNQVTFIFEMEAILLIYKTFAFLDGDLTTDAAALETI